MLSVLILVSVVILFGLLVWGKVPAFKLFLGLVFVYYLTDLISLDKFLGNFMNPALMTLVFLVLVGVVLERTIFFRALANQLTSRSTRVTITKMVGGAGLSSAFLNNTAIVAMFMPLYGRSKVISPSQLLLPLTYIATLGGTMTLLGTATHLIVNGFLIQSGMEPLGVFDFFYVGIFLLVFGALTILICAPFILPNHKVDADTSKQYLIETVVQDGSELVGKSIEQAGLRQLEELFLAQLISSDNVYTPVSPQQIIHAGDRLLFSGNLKSAAKLLLFQGLVFAEEHAEATKHRKFVEVILSQHSPMVGLTIKQANFRNKFNAAVVAIKRGDAVLESRLSEEVLRGGEALVLLVGNDFEKRDNLTKNFYFYKHLDLERVLNTQDSLMASMGFFAVIGLAALGIIPLIKGLMVLFVLYLLLGFVSFNEIRKKVPVELVLIIGSALGIAQVLTSTGTSTLLASGMMSLFGAWGVWGAFIGVYLLTVTTTEFVNHNASAALVFPIALATATALDVSAWPFIMAVVYGASSSFLNPYGYQTNLMVFSAGGYKFTDYVKLGLPLTLVYGAVALTVIPWFFPF